MSQTDREDETLGTPPSRRAVIRDGALLLAGVGAAAMSDAHATAPPTPPALRIGLITDMHYADKPPRGTRYYRQTLGKFREAIGRFNDDRVDFVVELGDFIDRAESVDDELGYLKTIEAEYAKLTCERHYVLGNHCVDTLTKEQFVEHCGATKTYYGFDRGGFHFVVIDACFNSGMEPYGHHNFEWFDANVPPAELAWLEADLKKSTLPVIVFAHQRLDVTERHSTKNAADVRKILEASGRVRLVLQGHSHANDYQLINGVHYCTLVAMIEGDGVENNGYSTMKLWPDGAIRIEGFRKQKNYAW
ncbi:MAG: alkaline phosphatase [Phycisphaera sp.]|nr:alkaline phosphatase [Phycisphaera sp.]